ncbi:MAG: ATP-binding cassette domain-containing protein [Cyclobacteriaceae bacterium]|nr:ATP-binding cassette domain-containing protein [Cyclobacteriaceae bacterium]
MELLFTEGISKCFGNFWALKNINIRVPRESIFGLLGPNGAGKTTLIRIITQIIFADEGEIFFENRKMKPDDISFIGYLPEERGLYKKMKVGEHMIYLARLKGLSSHDAKERIKYWMDKFDILSWWNKRIEDLSKGMQQKVQFISTILHEPRLIILDEPFSGFDPINANLIKDEILELKKKGSTIIFSTHRMESVEELCDFIALIHKSRVILDGSKQDIKQKYKSDTFVIEHRNDFGDLDRNFSVIQKDRLEDNFYRSVIQINNGKSRNTLLSVLIQKVEVHSFIEQVPSMNEIFISQVNTIRNE